VTAAATPVLEVDQLSRAFGGLMAVDRVDTAVAAGEIRGLIGPNGSGKSTLLNVVSGIYGATGGHIRLAGEDITRASAPARTRRGVARTFQNIRLFARLTVLENVAAACYCRSRAGLLAVLLRTPRMRAEEREIQQRARDALELVGLSGRADVHPGDLPYGQRRLVEIARALATEPRVLLLDEPAAGLTPAEKEQLLALIRRLNEERGLTLVLVEHDMHVIMNICDRITVLNFGAKIGEGTADEVRQNPAVIEAYLGRGQHHAEGD
jgi:branched-chain amino acid transport system ATP-binding protein